MPCDRTEGPAQPGHAGADFGIPAGAAGGGVGWGLGGAEQVKGYLVLSNELNSVAAEAIR